MPQIRKRNHYLPQLYLNQFLLEDNFWVYYKNGEDAVPQTPVNTCVEKHLYTFKQPNGRIDDTLEKSLSDIENKSKPILTRWSDKDYKLTNEDYHDNKSEISIFISFLASRVPKNIENTREIFKQSLFSELEDISNKPNKFDKLYNDLLKDKEFNLSKQQLLDFFKDPEKHYKIDVNKDLSVASSFNLAWPIHQEIYTINWCLCKAPSNTLFITSDAPVVPHGIQIDGEPIIGAGYGLPNIQVIFPISPYKCLIFKRKNMQLNRTGSKKFITFINKLIAWNSENIIISSIKSKYTDRLAKWHQLQKN